MKQAIAALVAVGLVGTVAGAKAQQWTAVGSPDNVSSGSGQQYWDNPSNDGTHCNVGYVLNGVAGSSGNSCSNQRPAGWLPYTGATPTTYLEQIGGGYQPFLFGSGSYDFALLAGTGSSGGDIAAANQDWGYYDAVTLTKTSLNSTIPSGPVVMGDAWGFYILMTNGNYAYSASDNQFALFGFNSVGPAGVGNDGTNWILGIEDIATTSGGGSDKDYQDELLRFSVDNGGGTPTEVIPEPGTISLLATGLVGMSFAGRRRRKKIG